ncbi:MAG: family 20 glycosylhydrolase [Limisphaerales bacterium]
MKRLLLFLLLAALLEAAAPSRHAWLAHWRKANPVWRGVQLGISDDAAADRLIAEAPRLAALGVNALVIEIDYGFDFQSHPELRLGRYLTRSKAAELAKACRDHGIRPIPLFNCLGHQSWAKTTFPLLTKYPELDETPGVAPGNQGIYCRSWCPQNPKVNPIVFALIDDIADAFSADAFHVGMDEVFLIASEHCPRCQGRNPAKLFAKAVNDLHAHIAGRRKMEMLMWGDRLLDAKTMGYGKWESSSNETSPAINLVSKDIILCDWHYEKKADYPSLPLFLKRGFRVWPCGWKNVEATNALIDAEQRLRGARMLGHLCTTWGAVGIPQLADWPPIVTAMQKCAK